jgi:hypothetical protein
MRITESQLRRIVREEARRTLGEGFDTESGLPDDPKSVVTIIRGLMGKLGSLELDGRERITLRLILANAGNNDALMSQVASAIVKNKEMFHKELGIAPKPAAPPAPASKAAPAAPADDDDDDDDDDIRKKYRQKILQGISAGRKDWSNFPGPGGD